MSAEIVRTGKNNVTVEASYDFGNSLDEMRQKFGDDVVYSNAKQQMRIGVQSLMRRRIEKGEDEGTIKNAVSSYTPGMAGERQDPIEKFKAKWQGLSKEEQNKLLNELKQQAK